MMTSQMARAAHRASPRASPTVVPRTTLWPQEGMSNALSMALRDSDASEPFVESLNLDLDLLFQFVRTARMSRLG